MRDADAGDGVAARCAVRCLPLLVLVRGAVCEDEGVLEIGEERREVGLVPLLALLLLVVLAAREHLALVPRGERVLHLASLVHQQDVLVEGVVEARVALVARIAKVDVRAQRDLLLLRSHALGVGDHLAREALGVVLVDHVLGVGGHRPYLG